MSKPKKYIIWIILILVVAGAVFYFVTSRKSKTEYTTETASRGNLAQTVSVTGEAKPVRDANLSFEFSGVITKIYVEEGSEVKEGDLLAELDSTDQKAAIASAAADVEAQNEAWLNMIYNKNAYDKHQRAAQEALVVKAKSALHQAYVNSSKTKIYAPFDGQILEKNYAESENIAANSPILKLMGEGGLEIHADIPESDIVKVVANQRAGITFDALPSDEVLEAEVSQIDPGSTVIQDVVYYRAKLNIPNDPRIKPGMSADIDIRTAEENDVIRIPLRAVKEDGNKKYVELLKVVDKAETTEKVYVETGLKGDDGMVEIVSGLSGGEKVVTFIKTQ